MAIVNVSCPTGLMFGAIRLGGLGGEALQGSGEVCGAAGLPMVLQSKGKQTRLQRGLDNNAL